VLDAAADWFKANHSLDLTFLIQRKDTGYPSVIDGQATQHSVSMGSAIDWA
jgi:hypothetical protein